MKNKAIKSGLQLFLFIATLSSVTELRAQNTNVFPLNGNVGIGTLVPDVPLDISKPTTIGLRIRNNNPSTTADGSVMLDMSNNSGNFWRMAVGGKNSAVAGMNAGQFYIERSGLGTTFLITQSGLVGINTKAPAAQLDVASAGYLVGRFTNNNTASNTDGTSVLDISNSAGNSWRLATSGKNNGLGVAAGQFYIERTGWGACLTISSQGNVLINRITQTNTTYKLDVNGKVRANEIVVNTTGADFVFAEDYKLRELKEVELFIKKNKHLPGIVPASVMSEQGMEVGELTKTLLQKVEELTLYVIEQQKEIELLKGKTNK